MSPYSAHVVMRILRVYGSRVARTSSSAEKAVGGVLGCRGGPDVGHTAQVKDHVELSRWQDPLLGNQVANEDSFGHGALREPTRVPVC